LNSLLQCLVGLLRLWNTNLGISGRLIIASASASDTSSVGGIRFPGAEPNDSPVALTSGGSGFWRWITVMRSLGESIVCRGNGMGQSLVEHSDDRIAGVRRFPERSSGSSPSAPSSARRCCHRKPSLTDPAVVRRSRNWGYTQRNIHDLVNFVSEGLTDQRVALEKGPFDHPQLFVPNGTNDVTPGEDNFLEVQAVGRRGRATPIGTFLNLQPQTP
jgi:hypothetical protein